MNDNEGKIILKIKYFDEIKIEMNESDKAFQKVVDALNGLP